MARLTTSAHWPAQAPSVLPLSEFTTIQHSTRACDSGSKLASVSNKLIPVDLTCQKSTFAICVMLTSKS